MSPETIGIAIGTALAIIGVAVTWLRSFGPSRLLPNGGRSMSDRLDDCIVERDELRRIAADAVREQLGRGRDEKGLTDAISE